MYLKISTPSESFTSQVLTASHVEKREPVYIQTNLSAPATVRIQGRLEDDMPWVDLRAVTEDGIYSLQAADEMRIVVEGNAGRVQLLLSQ